MSKIKFAKEDIKKLKITTMFKMLLKIQSHIVMSLRYYL